QHLAPMGIEVFRYGLVSRDRYRALGEGGFGRPDDHAGLVDPDAARYVDNSEQLVQQMRLVDQRRVLGRGPLDPAPRTLQAPRVERDGDHLQAERMQLLAQSLPPGQVQAAASPRVTGKEADLMVAKGADNEGPDVPVR